MIAGAGHFTRVGDLPPPRRNVVQLLEESYPGSTRIVMPHFIFPDIFAQRREQAEALQARLAEWPIPSIAPIENTWLADIEASLLFGDQARRIEPDGTEVLVEAFLDGRGNALRNVTLGQLVDEYLYLGPSVALSLVAPRPGS